MRRLGGVLAGLCTPPCWQGRTVLWVAVALASCIAIANARAQSSAQSPGPNSRAWSVTFENDLFFNTDHYYTDGVQIATKTKRKGDAPGPFELFKQVCDVIACGKTEGTERTDRVGQLMYTPTRITIATPQPYDRPWAGLLYYAADVELVEEQVKSRTVFTAEFGLTGPSSLAEPTQKFIHRTFSGSPPAGWSNQIKSELGVMALVERRRAVPAFSWRSDSAVSLNTTSTWRLAVGNIMTFAAIGAMFEVGRGISPTSKSNDQIGTKSLGPEIFSQILDDASSPPPDETRCFFSWLECSASLAFEGRWVVRNMFLDGPLFRSGPSDSKRPLVGEVISSIKFGFPRTRSSWNGPLFVQLTATHRTSEFRSPKFSVPSQNWDHAGDLVLVDRALQSVGVELTGSFLTSCPLSWPTSRRDVREGLSV